jgi:hypothetical protein
MPTAGPAGAAELAEGGSISACLRGRPGRGFCPDARDRRASRAASILGSSFTVTDLATVTGRSITAHLPLPAVPAGS